MPRGSDWIHFIFVNLGFVAQVFVMYYFSAINNIKADWPKYRCNPMYMPLSDNLEQDFTYCIQNMQTNYMGFLLQPITYLITSLSSMGGDFTTAINDARNMISNIRSFITSIIQNVFGVFLNLVIEFQKITISIKDLIGKIIGTMVTLMYMIDGSVQTAQSTWNGPPGQMVRALGNVCFHPDTIVTLSDNTVKKMKDLDLGDMLQNGSRVDAVMRLSNVTEEPLYKLPGDIYVTGSHMIYDKMSNKFIQVKHFTDAQIQTEVTSEWFSCLITSNHVITIGDYVFWDWEDDIFKKSP
jgi:hypothetical protein